MKTIARIAAATLAVLFFACWIGQGTALADGNRNYKGVLLNVASTDKDLKTEWTFSLINLTNNTIHIGAASEVSQALGDNFPYNTDFPSGNSKGTKVNLTTWKSSYLAHPFPANYEADVNFHIQDGTSGLYDFSLQFLMFSSGGVPDGSMAYAYFQPVFGSTSWKYSNQVTNDSGYYADPPRTSDNVKYSPTPEGIVFAISDKYVLCLYKPNMYDNGENQLIMVVTQRFANNSYHGNHLKWSLY